MVARVAHRRESDVRSYSRSFPVVFERASGSYLYDVDGRAYLDFFCGAGSLNYGHNDPGMKQALIRYLEADGVMHSLDMATRARTEFLDRLESVILAPRRADYRVQFTGPTGTNGVEAALKLARKVTRRANVIAFTQAYHGHSLGALAVTANTFYRDEAFVNRSNVAFMPFDGYFGPGVDTLGYLRRFIEDTSSGVDLPAAIILETIQGEGGVNVASTGWLQGVQALCREFDILLIVDDVQVGCGRGGTFFSFEPAGLEPDMIVLSKSISGFGLPMSLLLMRPSLDQWQPGEHSGTFRGSGAAIVTATEALRFWENPEFARHLERTSRQFHGELVRLCDRFADLSFTVRGRGVIYGLESPDAAVNQQLARACFERGMVVELCGASRNVLKLLPPLTIRADELQAGIEILERSLEAVGRASVVGRGL